MVNLLSKLNIPEEPTNLPTPAPISSDDPGNRKFVSGSVQLHPMVYTISWWF